MEQTTFLNIAENLKKTLELENTDPSTINAVLISAFDQLGIDQKATLIYRALDIKLADAAEVKLQHGVVHVDSASLPSLEYANQLELIKLKSWLLKFVIYSLLACFIAFILIMVFVSGRDSQASVSDYFTDLYNIMRLILFNKT